MFLKLLKFEFLKSMKKSKLVLVLLAFIALSGMLFYFQHRQATAYQTEYRNGLQADIEMFSNRIAELEYEYDNTNDEERRSEITTTINSSLAPFEEIRREELHAFEELDTEEYLSWFIEGIETSGFVHNEYTDDRVLSTTRQEMIHIREAEAEPMTPLNYIYLDIEERYYTEEALELWQEQNPRFYNFGLYYIWYLIKEQAFIVFLVFVIILFGSFLRSERTSKRHSLDFLHTQTVNPIQVLYSKYIVSFIQIVFLLGVFISGVLGFGTVINALGSWDYPVVGFLPSEGLQPPERIVIPLSEYLRDNFLLMIFGILFILSVMYLLNSLLKSEITIVFTGIAILAGGYLFPSHPYNPFTYLDPSAIVTGKHMYLLNEPRYSMLTGIVLLSGVSLLLMGIHTLMVKRKDLR